MKSTKPMRHYTVAGKVFNISTDATFRTSKTDKASLIELGQRALRNRIDTTFTTRSDGLKFSLDGKLLSSFDTFSEFLSMLPYEEVANSHSRPDWISPGLITKYLDAHILIISIQIVEEEGISDDWFESGQINKSFLRSRRGNGTYTYLGRFKGLDNVEYVVLNSLNTVTNNKVVIPVDEFKEVYFIEGRS